jgi:diguanylate cyclase (GGDEF)-like protein/PAS domain S-box-containing protein
MFSAARLTRLIFLASSLCAGGTASALENVTLQLKWPHAFQFAGYYAAKEHGFYREAGLDVSIEEAAPDSDPAASVLNGKAQFGIGTSSLLLPRNAGKPVVVLAVIFQHSPYVFFTAQNAGIENLHDLSGKRVMLEPQSEELLAYLKKENVELNRIKQMRHSFNPQDLIDGKVDAMAGYISGQPYAFNHAGFTYKTFSPRMAGIDFYGDNLFTSEQEVQDHPERVRAFREASLRGWRYAKEHRAEIIELILKKYTKQHNRDYLEFESEQILPLLQPDLIEIGNSNPARWQRIADVYTAVGMLPHGFTLEGFLYEEQPQHNLVLLYRALGIGLLLFILLGTVAGYIYRVNRKLELSIAALEKLNQREHARIHVLELLSAGAPLPQILDEVVRSIEVQNSGILCSILLMDDDGLHLNVGAAPSLPDFYNTAINGLPIGPNVGSCGSTAYSGKRTIVENVLTHPSWAPYKDLAAQAGLGSCWSEPILSSSGKVLGTLAFYHRHAQMPDEADIKLIEQAAHLSSVVIEKIQDAQALQQSHDMLSKISAEVPGIIFQFRLYPDGRCCFPFISEAVRKMYGLTPEALRKDATPFFGFRHPEDANRLEESVQESARTLSRWHIEYRLILPGQGTRWRLGDAQPERLADGSTAWHGFITDITERKNVEERIRRMAQYDTLTELPNRALLSDRLQLALASAKRDGSHLALLFLDLDKFKPINDSLGHAVGDVLLKQAAVRMQRCVRESDTIARIGGDEFIVLLPHIETAKDVENVAEKIRKSLSEPFNTEGHTLEISASIGIAIYPEDGEDEIELTQNADLAMYYSKQGGRNIVMNYHREMKVSGQ